MSKSEGVTQLEKGVGRLGREGEMGGGGEKAPTSTQETDRPSYSCFK